MSNTIKWKKSGPFGSGMTLWEAETQKGAMTVHTFGRDEFTLSYGTMHQLPYFKSFEKAAQAAQSFVDFVPKKRSKKEKSSD
jgi:hypothetical protein